jgi:hypothetical protein
MNNFYIILLVLIIKSLFISTIFVLWVWGVINTAKDIKEFIIRPLFKLKRM